MKRFLRTFISLALVSIFVVFLVPYSKAEAAPATEEEVDRFSGYSTAVELRATSTETVNYYRRETLLITTVRGVPKYIQIADLENACGAIGGAMVVGFYDKYFEELIPNYQTYVESGPYKGRDSVYIPALIRELYALMRTNIDDVGVSQADCLNGLVAYVNSKGRNVIYTDVKNGNRVDEERYLTSIRANNPVLLFTKKMDLYQISLMDNADLLVKSTYAGGHICVGYAFYTVNYYNEANRIIRTDKYIEVATGLPTKSGYLRISSTDWCNAAYGVGIY